MYKGTISSLFDNNFKYNVRVKELPFGMIRKIKNEVYVFSDKGIRKIDIELECNQDIIYLKTIQVSLILEIDQTKIKTTLKNVCIKKTESGIYQLDFKELILN